MALHRDLTGSELHEPKGVDVAAAGSVYRANGLGSGSWVPMQEGNYLLNKYWLTAKMADVSEPNNHVYFFVPVKSKIVSLSAVLDGTITTADSTLTIYVNGTPYTDTLLIPFAGSIAGAGYNRLSATENIINAGVVIEVRSNGNSSGVAPAFIQLGLEAIV